MALDILVTSDRIGSDPDARGLIDYLRDNAAKLQLTDAALYYDFPTYSDYETVTHRPDVMIVSAIHGIVAVRFVAEENLFNEGSAEAREVDESLAQFSSILIGRLLKSKLLRKGRAQLELEVTPLLFALNGKAVPDYIESEIAYSYEGVSQLLNSLIQPVPINEEQYAEVRSVVEGAKALTRPVKRTIANSEEQKPAVALAKLEAEIANFDQKQRRAALITIEGPHRIRGLAGSGKTVIIAMKAAHLHLTKPDEKILITFLTKSLRVTIKSLITKFYRHYKDEDPNWDNVHIKHGWGGASTRGTYADACREHNVQPLNLKDARQLAPAGVPPFEFACRHLADSVQLRPLYDHVLIDEGQDFPAAFYELVYGITSGTRDRKNIVWAYDELQNILNVKMRTPEQLFGLDNDGQPKVSLERSGNNLPPGATNDTVLNKCYRNQREVLITAHALGFGIYDEIVQLLEGEDHWKDVGYELIAGDLKVVGSQIEILRPEENNPLVLEDSGGIPLIDVMPCAKFSEEIEWIASGIQNFLAAGLNPQDIVVIALDDKNARNYFQHLSQNLAEARISTNNIIADPYSEPPFSIDGKVTLSTVYRAKGNEAAAVFVIGVDAVSLETRSGRNKLFTAFTRSKAWLRVSGVGPVADAIAQEISSARDLSPVLKFVMPNLKQVDLIQRDLSDRAVRAMKIREEYIGRLREDGWSDEEIVDILVAEPKNAAA